MSSPEAARLAALIRTGMKDQALSGVELARRVGQLMGCNYSPVYLSRALNGDRRPLIQVGTDLLTGKRVVTDMAPELDAICKSLGVSREEAIRDAMRPVTEGEPT